MSNAQEILDNQYLFSSPLMLLSLITANVSGFVFQNAIIRLEMETLGNGNKPAIFSPLRANNCDLFAFGLRKIAIFSLFRLKYMLFAFHSADFVIILLSFFSRRTPPPGPYFIVLHLNYPSLLVSR